MYNPVISSYKVNNMSMKETIDFPLMKHDVSRFILSPDCAFVSGARKIKTLAEKQSEHTFSVELMSVLEDHKSKFIKDFQMALLFVRDNKDNQVKIPFANWFMNATHFNLHYTELLIYACVENHKNLIKTSIPAENFEKDILMLTELAIKEFAFSTLSYIQDYLEESHTALLPVFSKTLSGKAGNQKNFLNLLIAHYRTGPDYNNRKNIMQTLQISDFCLKDLALIQKSRHAYYKNHADSEKERFTERFSFLIESGFFDNDAFISKSDSQDSNTVDQSKTNTIDYLMTAFNDIEKKVFHDLLSQRKLHLIK